MASFRAEGSLFMEVCEGEDSDIEEEDEDCTSDIVPVFVEHALQDINGENDLHDLMITDNESDDADKNSKQTSINYFSEDKWKPGDNLVPRASCPFYIRGVRRRSPWHWPVTSNR